MSDSRPSRHPAVTALDEIVGDGAPVVSVAPIPLAAEGRILPLHVRVSAPVSGSGSPVLLLSHGNGLSADDYAPLAAFWASRGFVVVQPTHLDSARDGIGAADPRRTGIWRQRRLDLLAVLAQLDAIEAAVPGLAGRMDPDVVVAAGHSWGAQTVQLLLGARTLDADGVMGEDLADSRVRAGVLLAATGVADDLQSFHAGPIPFPPPSFDELTTPALVVAGDHDRSRMTTRGPDWFTDAFTRAPGGKDLVVLHGGEHYLGGVSGWGSALTTDDDPVRLAVVQRLTTAWLRSAIDGGSTWRDAARTVAALAADVARIDSRPSS